MPSKPPVAIAAEPLRESAHTALIAAHISEGNSAEAHRYFRHYCHLLWNELRLSPSFSFEQLLSLHAPRGPSMRTGTGSIKQRVPAS